MYKYYKHSNIVESMPQCANIQLVSKHIRLKDRVLLNLTRHWKSLHCFTKTQIYSLKFLTLLFKHYRDINFFAICTKYTIPNWNFQSNAKIKTMTKLQNGKMKRMLKLGHLSNQVGASLHGIIGASPRLPTAIPRAANPTLSQHLHLKCLNKSSCGKKRG